ncbi:MAG: PHP domain-containing protein [Victivallales bacterium]
MIIDLHTHSTASDGTCTPSQLLSLASEKGLGAIALTDHDTVSGLDEFLRDSIEYPDIKVVPGVEISVKHYDYSIHVLGLFIDYRTDALLKMLSEVRKGRNARNDLIALKLKKQGYDICIEEVNELAGGECPGRPHFASILVKKGYFATMQEAFDKCLKNGRSGYCKRELPMPGDAIDVIHAAGGLAIWAHPMSFSDTSRKTISKLMKFFVGKGLDGVEAYYPLFSNEQSAMLLELAEKHGIAVSGGSDFHGVNMKNIELGTGTGTLAVPFSVYEKLVEFHEKKRIS